MPCTWLNIWGNGHFGIDEHLKGGELPAIETKAHRTSVNPSVLTCVPAGGIGVEGHRRDINKNPTVLRHGVCRVGRWRRIVCIARPVTQPTTDARPPDASWACA